MFQVIKKIGYYNIILMIIAIIALVLSIISLTRKGESFGGKCVQNPYSSLSCEEAGGLGLPCTLPEKDGSSDCNYAIGRECKCVKDDNGSD